MNKIQRDITELCTKAHIDSALIPKIIQAVYESGLDFSECSQREFEQTVNECAEGVVFNHSENVDDVVSIEAAILDTHADGDIEGAYQLIFATPFLREELEQNDYTAAELVDVIKLRR